MDSLIQQRAHLQSEPTNGLQVKVVKGDTLFSEGWCSKIPFILQGNIYHIDFYILTLGDCDNVLGIQWLITLDPILWDFDTLWMQFILFGCENVLRASHQLRYL